MCKNHTCLDKSICRPERDGPRCSCALYREYNDTSQKCEPVDSCLDPDPPCAQICHFKNGPFLCTCEEGYTVDRLEIGVGCFAPGKYIYVFFSSRITKCNDRQVTSLRFSSTLRMINRTWNQTLSSQEYIMFRGEKNRYVKIPNSKMLKLIDLIDDLKLKKNENGYYCE